MESLSKWSTILNDKVKKLNLTEENRREFLSRQIRLFQSYQDPDDSSANKEKSVISDGATSGGAVLAKMNSVEKDDELIPLDSSILNKNIGLSVIVIVTKSDCLSVLDKEMEYRIEHYDFIQYHIRRFCLDYGASLFYTTVKDKRTYDKLYKYMVHKLYDYSFSMPASVVERESIFIPSGWDNEGKINILLENSTTIKSDTQFSEIIYKPSIRKPLQRDVETVIAYEDQEFLSKLQILLNKTATPSVKSDDLASMVSNPGPSPVSLGGGAHKTPHKTPVLKNNPNQPDSTNLKNFFQNLLNKNAPSPATNATLLSSSANSAPEVKVENPTASPNNPSTNE
jgi:dynein light intermediate chain 1